jgi:hypothetical protein
MTVVVLDAQRTILVTDSGPTTQVTVQSMGLQGPQGLPTTVNGKSGTSITLTASDVGAIDATTRGAANGVAELDASGLVPTSELPISSLSGNFVDLSTAQTVNGVKSFGSIPVGPASNPTTGNQLSRKAYVDTMLPLAGGTLTGALTLAADPITALGASTKQYADKMLPLTGGTMTGNIVLVGDPISGLHPATKQYVDGLVQGLSDKYSVVAATTAALPANTYNNGTSGVGATLTGTANAALVAQDGVSLTVGQLLLVKNEATAANNGIYTLTQVGDGTHPYILTRHVDSDQTGEIAGSFTFVESGTVNAGSGWVVAQVGPTTIGTTSITYTQFSGAGEITAGTGLTKTGNQIALVTPVSIANGGTGSATQNFVDLTTAQTVAGAKTFSGQVIVNTATSNSVSITGTTTGQTLLRTNAFDTTSISLATLVSGESFDRFRLTTDGGMAWGPGSGTRDTFLSRAGAGILATSKTLVLGASTTLGSGGVGVLEMANAATTPTANPLGGGVLYAKSAVPIWLDTGGNTLGMSRTYDAQASADLFSFTTETDIPGCSITTVKVTGSNATVIIDGVFDMQMNGTAGNLVGFCNWNGVDQAKQAVFVASAAGNRASTGQAWRITGVTAGTYTAKLRASCSVSNGSNGIRGTHTSIVVQVIEN